MNEINMEVELFYYKETLLMRHPVFVTFYLYLSVVYLCDGAKQSHYFRVAGCKIETNCFEEKGIER